MKFNIDKFIHRPSFYFLAYQGMIFALFILIGILILLPYSIALKTNAFYIFCTFDIVFHVSMPFLIFYSFITFFLTKNLNNRKRLLFFFLLTSLLMSIPYFLFKDCLEPSAGDIGLGNAIIWIITLPLNVILFLLFTLIPFLFMTKKAKNDNTTINYPNNIFTIKPFKLLSFIGILIYTVNMLLFFFAGSYLTIMYIFDIINKQINF